MKPFHYFWLAGQYLNWRLRAGNAHGLHSPFVYQLYTTVLAPKPDTTDAQVTSADAIEALRQRLLADHSIIQVTDFGAGSQHEGNTGPAPTIPRQVAHIARSAAKAPALGQVLHRLVRHFHPEIAIELGTSLGLSTAYQTSALPAGGMLYSLEGCPNLSARAGQHLQGLGLHAHLVTGNIDHTLPVLLATLPRVDYVFFDANHRLEPTLRYFEQCLALAHEHTVFVFDDIYWSKEMAEAWRTICAHPRVRVTVDTFWLGLVFFHTSQPRQHFRLRV